MNAIGPYTLDQLLGQGGMATVYAAHHAELGRVALRVIVKAQHQADVLVAERQGAMLHRLLHENGCPGVPKAYELFEAPDYLCMPVEFIDGETLEKRLARGPLGEADAIRLGLIICDNLAFAHAFKAHDGRAIDHVVHGDIKPANLMIGRDGRVWILDYGISKPMREDTRTRNVFGAACYSSPERLLEKAFDHRIDLWALGVVLYEMVSKRRPYDGGEGEVREAMRRGMTPKPLREASPGYIAIVQKLLMLDPRRRYATAAEVREDLERLSRGEPPVLEHADDDRTRRTSSTTRSQTGTATERVPLPPVLAPRMPLDLKGRILAGALALVLVLVVVKGYREYSLASDAAAFTQELKTRTNVTPADWAAYGALAARGGFGWGLGEARHILHERYKDEALRHFKDYRDGFTRALAGAQRQKAEAALQKALQLEPDDREVRAMLQMTQAYGSAWDAGDGPAREALAGFEKAASLWDASPDPYLGMARVVAYRFPDAARVEQLMQQAERKGYRASPQAAQRDTATLADARRAQAAALFAPLRKRECGDFDPQILTRVLMLLEQSEHDYLTIPGFSADTTLNLGKTRELIQEAKSLCAGDKPAEKP